MNEFVLCAASLTIGLSLGLIGAGGSILTIPVFVYVLHVDPVSSGIYSMFVVGLSSLAGGLRSVFMKLVDFRVVILFGVPSVMGVFVSRLIIFPMIPDQIALTESHFIPKKTVFLFLVACLMMFAAIRMLRAKSIKVAKEEKQVWNWKRLIMRGILTGMITGLLGLGGGFLIVPAIYLWTNLNMKQAIGTTLIIIFLNASIGFLTCHSSMIIDWNMLIKFTTGSVIGILIGTKLAEKISAGVLKKIFGCVVLFIAIFALTSVLL